MSAIPEPDLPGPRFALVMEHPFGPPRRVIADVSAAMMRLREMASAMEELRAAFSAGAAVEWDISRDLTASAELAAKQAMDDALLSLRVYSGNSLHIAPGLISVTES